MIQFIPFIDWLAALTSITLLVVLWRAADIGQFEAASRCVVVAAAGVQVLSDAFLATRVALALQTVLAVYLIIRWRLRV